MRTILCLFFFALIVGPVALSVADAQERRKLLPRNQPPAAAPQVVEGPILDKLRERIVLRIAKAKAIETASTTGINGKKYTREQVEAAYARMEKELGDETIMAVVKEAAPPLAGKLAGGRLSDLLDLFLANLPAILEAIMKLLPLFL